MRHWLLILAITVSAHAQMVVRFEPDGGPPIRYIVPLGIEAPPDSAAAFRVVAAIPAGVPDELAKVGRTLRVELFTELVPNERAPETPSGYPRSQLVLPMSRLYPDEWHAHLRFQGGANKLQSPVIVAIADPRASIHYAWPPGADKRAAGCYNCERPTHLIGKSEADGVYELFTNGRFVAVRPEPDVFAGTPYAFYGEHGAGGRAGWNVVFDRTYRSATLGLSPLGSGWDSAIFKRLRALPDGSVEYRDGAEMWVFARKNDEYVAPEGLFLRLSRATSGWTLVDQQLRLTTFDDLGRLTSESDEFFDANKPGSGNTFHYLYGSDSRLSKIIDPVGRQSVLTWDRTTGLLRELIDWRSRWVQFEYAGSRLTTVRLPEVVNLSGLRPRIEYGYAAAGGSLKEQLDLATNLALIRDPKEAVSGGPARVTFTFAADRVTGQTWATGESATFTYSGSTVTVRDALGQERRYTVTENDTVNLLTDRAHVRELRELAVPVWSGAAFGQLPATLAPGVPATNNVDRVLAFAFDKGVLQSSKLDGVRETSFAYATAGGAPGLILKSSTTAGITRNFHYQSDAFLQSVEAGGKTIEIAQAHRNNTTPTSTNSTIATTNRYDDTGLLRASSSGGGTDPTSAGAKEEIEYYPATGPLHARGLPRVVRDGDDLVTTIEYPLPTRSKFTDPRGVITTTDVDAWDRLVQVRVERPGDPLVIHQSFAYDASGRLERTTQQKGPDPIVTSYTYDVMGRPLSTSTTGIATVGTMTTGTAYDLGARKVTTTHAGGAVTVNELDALGRVRRSVTDTGSSPIERHFAYDLASNQVFATDLFTATSSAFDPHGRVIATRAPNGAMATTEYDEWHRPKKVKNLTSDGTETVAESAFTFTAAGRLTSLKSKVSATTERETAFAWDGGGRTTRTVTNGRAASVPGRPATNWNVDARGAVEKETLPDGAENHFAYDASGAPNAYEDPTSESTVTTRDKLGRPLTRTYPDGTTELVAWEGPRVKSVTDRQGRQQIYVYNAGGEVKEIRDEAANPTDVFDYDNAGRLMSWKTAGTEVTWGAFDLDGNPKETRQRRFRGESGLTTNPAVLDEVVQQHRWNEHGERTRLSMPVADGVVLANGWTRWLQQGYDPMGNVTSIARIDDDLATTAPQPVMSASYRGAGRPYVRTLVTSGGPIVRTYDYDPASSLLTRVAVTAKAVPIAGTAVKHDGLQTSEARMLGIASEERMSLFAYDARSRLAASIFGAKNAIDPTAPTPGSSREKVNAADYRNAQERTKILKPLSGVDSSQIDPPSAMFDEKPGGGHKIDKVTRGFQVRPFGWDGAERIDDGRFVYTFDARGRLIRATEKSALPPLRRALYTYTGAGRLVGRRVEYANVANPAEGDWKLEDRAQILTNDGLPAETTFAWDPVTDHLLAVYRAGATAAPLKQIIHGESAYDDPLETTTIDPSTGAVIRLYPIYDEAAAGSLQTVLNERAEVVARNLTNDPYGAHQLALTGPAIDGVAIRASKNAAGAIASVEVELHATEQLAPPTLPTGVRLATLAVSGAVVRTAAITPTLAPDAYTIRWTLTPAEWEALTAPPATTLSIAATDHLRASTWSEEVPIMPAPDWAMASGRVLSSPNLPVEVRESLSSLAAYLAGIPNGEERTTELYEVETLALLGVSARGTAIEGVLSAGFQALPFAEGMTGLIYARARWYDPSTGSFLSADPIGYQDSSNLYVFAGGDPVNGRDPTGERIPYKEDIAMRQSLLRRVADLDAQWSQSGRATFRGYKKIQIQRGWLDTSGLPGEYNYVMQNTAVSTAAEYEAARAYLMNDVQTFDAAVARADELEPVYYVHSRDT
jgi:RHS repeat-associated protein